MLDCAIEANDGGETFVGIYMPTTGGASQGGVIIDNLRLQHVDAAAVAINIDNAAGMEIRSSYLMGNINVGSSCICKADNVRFSGVFGFTGTIANVFVNGEATGTWTPTIGFSTPGDQNIVYSTRLGRWSKIGKQVTVTFQIGTSTFTHTTAAGNLILSGLPFVAEDTYTHTNPIALYAGVTAAGAQHLGAAINPSTAQALFYKSGSGVPQTNLQAADLPSGGTVVLYGQITYRATT